MRVRSSISCGPTPTELDVVLVCNDIFIFEELGSACTCRPISQDSVMMGLGVNPGREGASRPCSKVQHPAPVGIFYARHTEEDERVRL